jgi:hypothetical protein
MQGTNSMKMEKTPKMKTSTDIPPGISVPGEMDTSDPVSNGEIL